MGLGNERGKVPAGHHIHHVNGDKSNNNIENLQVLSAKEHCRLHMTPERLEKSRAHAERIRPLTKKWHSSSEAKRVA